MIEPRVRRAAVAASLVVFLAWSGGATLSAQGGGARVGPDQAAAPDEGRDVVVVAVEDIPIHASDVYRMLDLAVPLEVERIRRQMALGLLGRVVARAEGVDVDAAELETAVEDALTEQRTRFALEVDDALPFEDYMLARHGLTLEQHRAQVRRMVLTSMLLERVVRLHQRRTPRDEIAIILVEDAALAEQIGAQLAEGASFSVLARRHSVHPSGPTGGGLPPVPTDAVIDLLAGREEMDVGEIRGPDLVPVGETAYWRLMRLVDRPDSTDAPWSELREEIETGLALRPIQAEELALFEEAARARYRVTTPDDTR